MASFDFKRRRTTMYNIIYVRRIRKKLKKFIYLFVKSKQDNANTIRLARNNRFLINKIYRLKSGIGELDVIYLRLLMQNKFKISSYPSRDFNLNFSQVFYL